MKQLLLMGTLLFVGCLSTMAQDYKYLTASYNSTEKSFLLATVQKITFEDGNVVITTSKGVTKLPQEEMEKLFFSTTSVAIESMALESENLKMVNGILKAKGNGILHIYNSAGQLIQLANVDGEMNISLSKLPKGIYIVNLDGQTIKVNK